MNMPSRTALGSDSASDVSALKRELEELIINTFQGRKRKLGPQCSSSLSDARFDGLSGSEVFDLYWQSLSISLSSPSPPPTTASSSPSNQPPLSYKDVLISPQLRSLHNAFVNGLITNASRSASCRQQNDTVAPMVPGPVPLGAETSAGPSLPSPREKPLPGGRAAAVVVDPRLSDLMRRATTSFDDIFEIPSSQYYVPSSQYGSPLLPPNATFAPPARTLPYHPSAYLPASLVIDPRARSIIRKTLPPPASSSSSASAASAGSQTPEPPKIIGLSDHAMWLLVAGVRSYVCNVLQAVVQNGKDDEIRLKLQRQQGKRVDPAATSTSDDRAQEISRDSLLPLNPSSTLSPLSIVVDIPRTEGVAPPTPGLRTVGTPTAGESSATASSEHEVFWARFKQSTESRGVKPIGGVIRLPESTHVISSLDIMRVISTIPRLSGGFGSDYVSTAASATQRTAGKPKVNKPTGIEGAVETSTSANVSSSTARDAGDGLSSSAQEIGAAGASAQLSLEQAATSAMANGGAEDVDAEGGTDAQAQGRLKIPRAAAAQAVTKRAGGVLNVGSRYMWELGVKSWSEELQRNNSTTFSDIQR